VTEVTQALEEKILCNFLSKYGVAIVFVPEGQQQFAGR